MAASGCESPDTSDADANTPASTLRVPRISDARDATQHRPALCDRSADDAVRDLFCADAPAHIQSLADLQAGLGFDYRQPDSAGSANPDPYATSYSSFVVFLGHSTALSGQLVSPINPRAIMINASTFMAFSRGVQQVEVIAQDRTTSTLNFYLVSFEQACNDAVHGCVPGELYTPQVEADWLKVALQDGEELKNTPSDCLQCHQRGRSDPMLLMRELRGPWTHFFGSPDQQPLPFDEPLGGELARDYLLAKGAEAYAGVPAQVLVATVGFTLQNSVAQSQPLLFDGDAILNERWPWRPEGYLAQPSRSATWQAGYDAFKRGEQLALPYYAPRVTDLAKQAKLTDAYQRFLKAELSAAELPDLGDIYPDDPQTRAEIGLQTEPDATPAQAVVQACGTCHNDVLDQSLSRARFNVALDKMDRAELQSAIARLRLPRGSIGAMPPRDARQIDPATLPKLIAYLEQNERSAEDTSFLQHAAQAGMAMPQLRATDPEMRDDEDY